jgi:hypothetical protein
MEADMAVHRKIPLWVIGLSIMVSQVIATQVVTFILSLLLPGMENDYGLSRPLLFLSLIGISFSIGVFLVGWPALKLHWLASPPLLGWRLLGTLLGAFIPLFISYFLYQKFVPGNPFFLVSILMSVLGFHLPGWIKK